ncbi:AraC family transcriptional regulator [Microbacterium sp. K27]|uniref:AraC family transcriptional regulator n=1 Tax=Microbacterium sp. K27 TaxID=2305445 RepID=UPI00109B9DF3|nr:AraC family transcriptional regulator [Microbacterium sp. K27]
MFRPLPSVAPEPRSEAGEDVDAETEERSEEDGFGPWGHGTHRHDDDQFIVALSGSAVIDVDGERFAVDQSQGVWIPAGFPHSARFHPGFAPFVHRTGSPTDVVPTPCAVSVTGELRNRLLATSISRTDASPILCAALRKGGFHRPVREGGTPVAAGGDPVAAGTPVEAAGGDPDAAGSGCPATEHTRMRAEIARLARAELHGPLTVAISAALHADPSDDRTLDGWARRLHTSTTSIRRAFVAELGTSYTTWRTAVRLEAAVALLHRGYPVANAARAVGLTHNGLLAAFHRGYGCRPSAMRLSQTRDASPSSGSAASRSR